MIIKYEIFVQKHVQWLGNTPRVGGVNEAESGDGTASNQGKYKSRQILNFTFLYRTSYLNLFVCMKIHLTYNYHIR
jgi:hypothetical protein